MFACYNFVGDIMKIMKFKKLANSRYKIFLDNNETIILNEDIILDNNLLFKREIDDLDYLLEKNNKNDIYNKVVNYISIRIRSKKEIENYLKKFELLDSDFNYIINRLINNKLINDSLFVQCFINDKINLSYDGPYKINKELSKHDIDNNIIFDYLETINENIWIEKINTIISKQLKLNKKYNGFKLKNKIYLYLINLGYDSKMINVVFNNYSFNINNKNYEDVYKKIYNKYSKKYKDEKLEYVVKQKLYEMGYVKEDK